MKWILFLLGWLSFVLGIIGAFVPVLPTTPFLILSAFLFSRSSPRFHAWVLALPIAGEAVSDWNQHRVIRPRGKILCTLMVLLSLGSMWVFAQVPVFLKAFLTLLLSGVTIFVVTRKSHS